MRRDAWYISQQIDQILRIYESVGPIRLFFGCRLGWMSFDSSHKYCLHASLNTISLASRIISSSISIANSFTSSLYERRSIWARIGLVRLSRLCRTGAVCQIDFSSKFSILSVKWSGVDKIPVQTLSWQTERITGAKICKEVDCFKLQLFGLMLVCVHTYGVYTVAYTCLNCASIIAHRQISTH